MGLRDSIKTAAGTVAAGLTFALAAPGGARAMDSGEAGVMAPPRLVLPSQEAYQYSPASLVGEPDPIHIRVVKHPAFVGTIGICAAGYAGKVVVDQLQKKQAEQMRSVLSTKSGVDIDASILDEARINRPGAKTFIPTGGPAKFGVCLCV